MQRLLCARKLSAGEEAGHTLCDVCSSDEARPSEETSSAKPATKRCFQCQQNYCDQCSWYHTKIQAAASHDMVEIGKELQKTHNSSDIEEVSTNRRKQVKSDIDKITECLKKIGRVLPRFEKEKTDLVIRLADIEDEIESAVERLSLAVSEDLARLLQEVEFIRVKRVEQLETAKQEVEHHMARIEQYSELLMSSETACDVTRSANSLHSKVKELMMFDMDSFLPPLNVIFTSTSLPCVENFVGTIAEQSL